MNYEGKLYGKVGKKYFPLEMTTKDVDDVRDYAFIEGWKMCDSHHEVDGAASQLRADLKAWKEETK